MAEEMGDALYPSSTAAEPCHRQKAAAPLENTKSGGSSSKHYKEATWSMFPP